MAPISAADRQKLLLQQEIAKLSGAISRHAGSSNSHTSSYHPYRGYPSRGRGRGGATRGRGRGGAGYSLDLRANRPGSSSSTPTPSARPASAPASGRASPTEEGEVVDDKAPAAPPARGGEGWVKKTSKTGNMSLMTVEKSNQLLSRPKPRRVAVPPQIQVLKSTPDVSPGGSEAKRVVIDGVIFQFEEGGKKLTRIGELPSASGSNTASTPTRSSLSYGGEQYRRTKRGNLVSRSSISSRRAEQAKKPCRYYTKTGRCERALTCPYQHIPDRLAICPRFLRGACTLGDACPLSHTPSAHNTPSCVYFQASASCPRGDKCVYPHVVVTDDAPVCEAFAREGWCDLEAGTCPELHIWECPEYHATGKCSRGKRCGLRHVLHSEKNRAAAAAAKAAAPAVDDANAFDEQTEFIGVPGDVFSETDSEDSEDDEEEEAGESGSESEDEGIQVDDDGDKGKPPSSDVMDTDDDEAARVLGDL